MFVTKKGKAQSCLHAIRQGHSRLNFQKYVVVDSENQDEMINMRHYDSQENINHVLQTQDKGSVILKSKGSTVTNFMSNVSEPEMCVDNQIFCAQKQVKDLQKQCQLLENMINHMIEEQSKLAVLLKKRERAQTLNKQQIVRSELVSPETSLVQYKIQENVEQINSKVTNGILKKPLSIITPLLSRNIQRNHKKSLEIVKTVQIKSFTKPKKGRQNQKSKKILTNKKKSISGIKQTKQSTKKRSSICKMRSKVY